VGPTNKTEDQSSPSNSHGRLSVEKKRGRGTKGERERPDLNMGGMYRKSHLFDVFLPGKNAFCQQIKIKIQGGRMEFLQSAHDSTLAGGEGGGRVRNRSTRLQAFRKEDKVGLRQEGKKDIRSAIALMFRR